MFKFSHIPSLENFRGMLSLRSFTFLYILILFSSCAPKSILLDHPRIVSFYFERNISSLEKNNSGDLKDKRQILKTKVEYSYGVIMEENDRLIDNEYLKALQGYKKANILFNESKILSKEILNEKYPNFEEWLSNKIIIEFNKADIFDLYWLAAATGGSIKSSRGNPFELIYLPQVKKLLNTAIAIEPTWGSGALYSALLTYTTSRTDLTTDALRDSVNYYFNKAVEVSDSLDASPFLTYAESIHKPFQEKKEFEDKLNFILKMDNKRSSNFELSNLIAKKRAEWLLSKLDEYFIE